MINWLKRQWEKVKQWFSWLKKKAVLALAGGAIASAAVGTAVVDNQVNPYVETGRHFEISVAEQLPEQGSQYVRFLKGRPEMELTKWNEEVAMRVRYDGEPQVNVARGNRPLLSDKVEWKGQNETVRGYQIDDENYEFEVVLASKPTKNTFDFVVEGAENLNFFYQPALTQEEVDDGAERPENVVGSYAVYHKTKAHHRTGNTNYATGKAFHIYRPKAIDVNGAEEWAELSYQNGVLTVTVPQSFLDNAVYPVVVDPTFGYTSIGAATSGLAANIISGTTDTLPEDGTVSMISMYISSGWVDGEKIKGSVFDSAGNYLSNETDEISTGLNNAAWNDFTFSAQPDLTSGDYGVVAFTDSSWVLAADSGSSGQCFDNSGQTYPTWPSSITCSSSFIKSIYATYTASATFTPKAIQF